jgi:hypothetical protein
MILMPVAQAFLPVRTESCAIKFQDSQPPLIRHCAQIKKSKDGCAKQQNTNADGQSPAGP